jgi:replicative DNA helicase
MTFPLQFPEAAILLRQPPQNVDAEKALLGAILMNNLAFERVSEFLEPRHFADPLHQRIYERAAALIRAGRAATPITLKPDFVNDPPMGRMTVPAYLGHLVAQSVSVLNTEAYGKTIHDLAIRRELIRIGEDMVNAAYDAPVDASPKEQIETAEQRLFGLATGSDDVVEPLEVHVSQVMRLAEKAYKLGTGLSGLSTGIRELDNLTGGLCNGDMIVLGGRPSMGKTALASTISRNIATSGFFTETGEAQGVPVAFFSLEMSAQGLARRELAAQSGVSSSAIKRGRYNDDDYLKMLSAEQDLSKLPLWIVKLRDATVASIKARARKLIRDKGVGFIVIDYLGLVECKEGKGSYEKTTLVSKGLKNMLSELNVPGLILSQLSRDVEKRENKRPQMTDLRDTGAIEQDADVIMFIHREEYYLQRNEPDLRDADKHDKWRADMDRWEKKGEISIPKQREGEIGTVEVSWDSGRSCFTDLIAA